MFVVSTDFNQKARYNLNRWIWSDFLIIIIIKGLFWVYVLRKFGIETTLIDNLEVRNTITKWIHQKKYLLTFIYCLLCLKWFVLFIILMQLLQLSDQLCFLSLVEIFYANVSAIFKIHWEINAIFISWFYKVYLLVPT